MAGSIYTMLFGSNQPRILQRALRDSSTAQFFTDTIKPTRDEPGTVIPGADMGYDEVPVFDTGVAGGLADPTQIFLIPTCYGAPGSSFYINVWGWRICGDDPATCVWIPSHLVMLLCTTGNIPGPAPATAGELSSLILTQTDNLCSRIAVFGGSLGVGQITNSFSGSPSSVTIGLRHCQKFQFDFGQGPEQSGLAMNALWALI